MNRALLLLAAAVLPAATFAQAGAWNSRTPDANADRLARLFKTVCVDHLGRSRAMHAAVRASGAKLERLFAGDRDFGPVWSSTQVNITATDHRHNHDGDECQINVRPEVAPSAEAAIAALRRLRLVHGEGQPSELGATGFAHGDSLIFVRYLAPDERSGVGREDSGLMLLIKRPPA